MHIILVSNRLATAKTLNLSYRTLLALLSGVIILAFATSFLFSWVGVRFNMPFAAELVAAVQQVHNRKTEEYMRYNVSSMAVKLGEMQAQLIRLDSLGERISRLSGVKPAKPEAIDKSGQGGPLVYSVQPHAADELQRDIDRLAEIVEQRSETLTELESQLMERRIKNALLPTMLPIKAEHVGSTFGYRVDPIAGVRAMHEGIDFVADKGTRVIASAGGVVQAAEYHPQYGNMIEIDHGNEFSSRYAHLSKIDVKAGQIVKRGQAIGASGNTGRSTGPHLHFEVRFKGVAQNPARFVRQSTQMALNSPLAARPVPLPEKRIAPPANTANTPNTRATATFSAPR
ncbi:Metalloendopeptidase-like membrane protein [Candidatus Propionivibrio aalborgensis]|uniref:Metalloendopeptidase-like membrane protein n=1 Tax=Candidatus Propionivibrio aalborgensis TaxID=1860101 RepID=A0A1A8XQG9_9RHOO|nr:M23 family metallopeptidase [Candidatus Propionivibrio aalborgensis]MBK9027635.1 M23 family metallopeptidase [Propionivibrio sp.]SBT06697.1 Metalloendopeptidase-like membrane protein [Candidatus Propionivibrio aalborgensis]